MANEQNKAFERVPTFHTDERTVGSVRRLISAIGGLGTRPIQVNGYFEYSYWKRVIARHGKLSSEQLQQLGETQHAMYTEYITPDRNGDGFAVAGMFSVLGEVVEFPRDSHRPLAMASWHARVFDGSGKDWCAIVNANYEISAAPLDSEHAGGVGVSLAVEIGTDGNVPAALPASPSMEIWDEMGLRTLQGDYPDEAPLPPAYFDGGAEQIEALTRFALGRWPESLE